MIDNKDPDAVARVREELERKPPVMRYLIGLAIGYSVAALLLLVVFIYYFAPLDASVYLGAR